MKNILAIHGLSGCGKSTTIRALLEFLPDYRHFSTGDTARAMAREEGMTIEEYMVHARQNHIAIDSILDNALRALSDSEDKYVVDSRLGYYHLKPGSAFNVCLVGDIDILAARRLEDLQTGDDRERYANCTLEDARQLIVGRDEKDMKKYRELYDGTNCNDRQNYHLVIDTTRTPKNRVVTYILVHYYNWQDGKFKGRVEISGNDVSYL